jgi:uncharacterized protein (TIRG00374 family)
MKLLHALLLALGIGFLAYLVWRIGFGELWRELGSLGWGLVPLLFSEGAAEFFHTLGWRRCLSAQHRTLGFWLLFRIRMAGYAINYLTPTAALGGEATRAGLLSAYGRGAEAVSGVLIDKACFAFGHLLFVVVGSVIILWRIPLPPALAVGMVVAGLLLAVGIVAFALLQKHGKLGAVVRWLAAHRIGGAKLRQAAEGITAVDESFRVFYRDHPRDLAVAVGWHLVGFPVGILQTWLFFALLNQPASFAVAASVWFLGLWFDLLTFAIPLNLGTLEGSRIVTFKAVGYQALQGMTFGVTLRLAQLVWALYGLINYALLASTSAPSLKKPAPSAPRTTYGEAPRGAAVASARLSKEGN